MDIFISWSKDSSQKLAVILKWWLKNTIQQLDPWVSDSDLDKGTRWFSVILKELEKAQLGIICLTPENIKEPWLLFEAGALVARLGQSNVCPVLLNLKSTDLSAPLSHFQTTSINKEDLFKLLTTINKALEGSCLTETRLKETFRTWWPKLNTRLKKLPTTSDKKYERPARDILEEVLSSVRNLEKGPLFKLLEYLTPREDKTIRMRYGIGEQRAYSTREIALVLGISENTVEKIEVKAKKRLGSSEGINRLLQG